jgi:hypothetical protein
MAELNRDESAIEAARLGRTRFALKLATFTALQLVLFAGVEVRLAQIPNPYNIKKARLV